MRISAKMLKNVINVNRWNYATEAIVSQGQPNSVFVQLVDLEHSFAEEKSKFFPEYPIRYISQATSLTASAYFDSLNDDDQFSVVGVQPFSDDRSIWRFNIPTNQVPRSGSLRITINEDGVERTFIVQQAISVEILNIGGC